MGLKPSHNIRICRKKSMGENQEFNIEFRVRLPSSLAERIAVTAKKEQRSRNAQYVYMLEDWFKMKEVIEMTEMEKAKKKAK